MRRQRAQRRLPPGAFEVDSFVPQEPEDFKPTFLAKSTMARKAADAAIGAAKRELIEQGVRAGRKVVLVPPAYTTMTCSQCFARAKQRLELAERVFRCQHCGYAAERDRNSARLILATVELDRAGVDDVRHCLPPSGGGGAVRAGNPRCGQAGTSPDFSRGGRVKGTTSTPPPLPWVRRPYGAFSSCTAAIAGRFR